MLALIRSGEAVTRADLARRTGLARSTIGRRVDSLIAHRFVYETADGAHARGRPAAVLAFNKGAGVVLVADLGATHTRLALADMAGTPRHELAVDLDIGDDPERVFAWLDGRFTELLAAAGRGAGDVRGIGVGLPGPVEFATGEPVEPPIMRGWGGFSIPAWFAKRYAAPVLVDNDVNMMALGEQRTYFRDCQHLLFVKVGAGVGSGIVAGSEVHRGAHGGAGDIGHISVAGHDHVVCRCGNAGCLEAVAGGPALARRLSALGLPAASTRDVVRLVQVGEPAAIQAVREAGRQLGEVLAGCVNFFNPSSIVIGGDLAHQVLLAGVREVAFRRSLPMATRSLRVVPSRLGDRAGVTGAAAMVVERILAPAAVDRVIEGEAAAAFQTLVVRG
jgi:predicted NBD/HSP70 family sugar kinase